YAAGCLVVFLPLEINYVPSSYIFGGYYKWRCEQGEWLIKNDKDTEPGTTEQKIRTWVGPGEAAKRQHVDVSLGHAERLRPGQYQQVALTLKPAGGRWLT
ncbi:hypothetical protein LSAT2_024707, partial [Lamellibrachia satsuma]